MSEGKLRIIPLGGLGEIGKNMMLLEHGENIIVIDAGLMFPENDMLGIDIVIPEFSHLLERKDKVWGIIITHGHEDHIGGLPYLLSQVNAPIYATRLTQGLIEVKLREQGLLGSAQLNTIQAGDELSLGPFHIEFFHVCHSIPDGVGLGIETPQGLVVHSGDFKLDYSPVDGRGPDFGKLADLSERGVMLLLSDSTNAETYGYTPSERELVGTFADIFAKAKGRVIVATFASNISRVQQVMDVAQEYGRRVAVVGRSMGENVKMAAQLDYLRLAAGLPLRVEEANRLPPEKVVIVCTGAQGEPTSALVRMASGEHRQVKIKPGDMVIVSAAPIPGNEELINRTINDLFRLGADVKYHELADVHVSGHANREELKLLLTLLRPKFFVPIHGEYRHLVLHARLAQEVGIPAENIFVVENGQILELDRGSLRVAGRVPAKGVLVDGLGVGDVGSVVLQDRVRLSQDGFMVVVIILDEETGQLLEGPEIISRGFVYMRDADELIAGAEEQVRLALRDGTKEALSDRMRKRLGQFLYERTKRRPMVLPVVIEV